MTGPVVVLSDIHGVVPALDAVLAEPEVAAAQRIVLTGDIAAGPQPNEVLVRLRELGERVLWVRGNADRELVALARGGALAGLDVSIRTVVCGHTHMPFIRLVDRRLVVNPGSVGMPYGRPGAHWALLDREVATPRVTDFDIDAACAAITRDCGYPGVDEWVDYFLRARASDTDAIAAFGPRDGRAV